jgi:hypothetical protein
MRYSGILLQQESCEAQSEREPNGINDKYLACRHRYPPLTYIFNDISVAAWFACAAPTFILSGLYIMGYFSLQARNNSVVMPLHKDDLPRHTR